MCGWIQSALANLLSSKGAIFQQERRFAYFYLSSSYLVTFPLFFLPFKLPFLWSSLKGNQGTKVHKKIWDRICLQTLCPNSELESSYHPMFRISMVWSRRISNSLETWNGHGEYVENHIVANWTTVIYWLREHLWKLTTLIHCIKNNIEISKDCLTLWGLVNMIKASLQARCNGSFTNRYYLTDTLCRNHLIGYYYLFPVYLLPSSWEGNLINSRDCVYQGWTISRSWRSSICISMMSHQLHSKK